MLFVGLEPRLDYVKVSVFMISQPMLDDRLPILGVPTKLLASSFGTDILRPF